MPSEGELTRYSPDAAVIAILDRLDVRFVALEQGDRPVVPASRHPELLQRSTRRFFALAARAIRENRTFTADELRPVREGAVQAAADGASLSAVLHSWHRFGRILLDECRVAAAGERAAALVDIAAAVLRLQEVVTRAVVESYESERIALEGDEQPSKELLARLLLAGQDADPTARWCGIELADEYSVLVIRRGGPPPDPPGRWSDQSRTRRVIDGWGPPPILAILEVDGATLLVPRKAAADADWYRVAVELAAAVSNTAAAPVTAAVTEPAGRGGLEASGGLARELLELASRMGRGPGVYQLKDLALPFQLSRPTAGQQYLADRLLPLDPYPELLETLDAYLHHDLDRARTAHALGVHPNTVNNRLGRIRDLAGIDPGCYEGIMTLGSALDARRARGGNA
ncbi:PucR family transcriptional regulator [Rhodococcus sp. W8901]|uniref:PucR family transcriptional regulator n=1 Tax=Rhodococcus sp. W8901 TaxID=2742603 RepID=UPI0015826A5C|nr:helix-turn-helix domain-containing protein [Rhodococcus sp. W8901]QKT13420.1 helix-turn-helix domain-containing protein [Rhodococcus sp. W8901]